MAKKISVSFKEKEIYLYDYLETKLNAAYYIKELILRDMQSNNQIVNAKKDKVEIGIKQNKQENLMDFDF